MKRKILIILVLAALSVTACSPGQQASSTLTASTAAPAVSTTPGAPVLSLEGKLAAGILLLEGSDNAITAEQAKNLLPLWKAVSTLATADTTTESEIQAVYRQIEEAMTTAQIDAIQAVDITGETMTNLMSQYGVEPGGDLFTRRNNSSGNSDNGNFPPAGAVGPGGGQFSAGGPPPDGARVFIQGADGGGAAPNFTEDAQTTPGAATGVNRRMMGMNNLFVQPLITLLKERAG